MIAGFKSQDRNKTKLVASAGGASRFSTCKSGLSMLLHTPFGVAKTKIGPQNTSFKSFSTGL